ncbi:mycofactocin precursor MftA [Naumannella cuiyingiana]|uniref:Mycofactocin n=1 Tax=Naumannella cuiyingiana TaxID=1347891 RepID=A0A7Z0D681_9ACTN|nr:mycofactocin precursor MftA [Naumannella cuiyingiana]NYI69655.1 mycofactocin precursor [Naumannella cuiyingiana]
MTIIDEQQAPVLEDERTEPLTGPANTESADDAEELLIEEVSIDGMCGVY